MLYFSEKERKRKKEIERKELFKCSRWDQKERRVRMKVQTVGGSISSPTFFNGIDSTDIEREIALESAILAHKWLMKRCLERTWRVPNERKGKVRMKEKEWTNESWLIEWTTWVNGYHFLSLPLFVLYPFSLPSPFSYRISLFLNAIFHLSFFLGLFWMKTKWEGREKEWKRAEKKGNGEHFQPFLSSSSFRMTCCSVSHRLNLWTRIIELTWSKRCKKMGEKGRKAILSVRRNQREREREVIKEKRNRWERMWRGRKMCVCVRIINHTVGTQRRRNREREREERERKRRREKGERGEKDPHLQFCWVQRIEITGNRVQIQSFFSPFNPSVTLFFFFVSWNVFNLSLFLFPCSFSLSFSVFLSIFLPRNKEKRDGWNEQVCWRWITLIEKSSHSCFENCFLMDFFPFFRSSNLSSLFVPLRSPLSLSPFLFSNLLLE